MLCVNRNHIEYNNFTYPSVRIFFLFEKRDVIYRNITSFPTNNVNNFSQIKVVYLFGSFIHNKVDILRFMMIIKVTDTNYYLTEILTSLIHECIAKDNFSRLFSINLFLLRQRLYNAIVY